MKIKKKLFSLYSENKKKVIFTVQWKWLFLLFSLRSRGDIWRHDFIGQKTVTCAHSAHGRRGVVVSENKCIHYFHCTVRIMNAVISHSENNFFCYFHYTVKLMNAVILTGKICKGRIKRKQNICNRVRTCIGLTSRSTAQRSDNYATPADIIQRC